MSRSREERPTNSPPDIMAELLRAKPRGLRGAQPPPAPYVRPLNDLVAVFEHEPAGTPRRTAVLRPRPIPVLQARRRAVPMFRDWSGWFRNGAIGWNGEFVTVCDGRRAIQGWVVRPGGAQNRDRSKQGPETIDYRARVVVAEIAVIADEHTVHALFLIDDQARCVIELPTAGLGESGLTDFADAVGIPYRRYQPRRDFAAGLPVYWASATAARPAPSIGSVPSTSPFATYFGTPAGTHVQGPYFPVRLAEWLGPN